MKKALFTWIAATFLLLVIQSCKNNQEDSDIKPSEKVGEGILTLKRNGIVLNMPVVLVRYTDHSGSTVVPMGILTTSGGNLTILLSWDYSSGNKTLDLLPKNATINVGIDQYYTMAMYWGTNELMSHYAAKNPERLDQLVVEKFDGKKFKAKFSATAKSLSSAYPDYELTDGEIDINLY